MTGIGLSSYFIPALPATKLAFLRVSFIISPLLVIHCSILDLASACALFAVIDSAAQVPIVNVRHPHRHHLVPQSRLLGGGGRGASPRWRRVFQRRRHQPLLSYGIFGVNLVHPNGKSLEQVGSVTENVVLCSGLVDGGRWSKDYCRRRIEPHCIILSQYPNSWTYSCNIHSHGQPYNQHN